MIVYKITNLINGKTYIGQSLIARTIVPVECVETGVRYSSAKEASEKLDISRGNLSSVLTGNRKSAGGLSFKYAEKE